MPTPAMHLALAEEILRGDSLSAPTRRLLNRHPGPFLLGHTAPDVRSVSGQRRETCHFYTVPRTSERPAYQVLFTAHPSLGRVEALPPPHVAFVAGYVAHLELDELWLDDVFHSFLLQDWAPLKERLFLHNVLRTWTDYRAREVLDNRVAWRLQGAEPRNWLPFVDDAHLRLWRDWLVEQLTPGQAMDTAEVLANRMGIGAREIESVAQSPSNMEERIFRHLPPSALQHFHKKGYRRSLALIDAYVRGAVPGAPDPTLDDQAIRWSPHPSPS